MNFFLKISGLLAAAAAASAGELPSFPTDTSYSATSVTSPQSMGMSNVLRVVVDNMLYPVSIDALHIVSIVLIFKSVQLDLKHLLSPL